MRDAYETCQETGREENTGDLVIDGRMILKRILLDSSG
jgi:hypothetical protein